MLAEEREHSALILWAKVKKTVPGDDALKSRVQIKLSHIRDDPALLRKPKLANVDQRRRGVHAGDLTSLLDEETGYWFGGPTSNVKNRAFGRYETEEVIEPRFLEEVASSILVPIPGMSFIQANDLGRL